MNHLSRSERNAERAFTRLELIACIMALTLLITLIVPALANSGARSDRVTCLNNLRQIGLGYTQFGWEHQDLPPWRLPSSQGGNNDHPLKNNLYTQFSIISNSLAHPRHLRDPGDNRPGLAPATKWDNDPNGGIHAPNYRNKAVSYFLGLDSTFRVPRAVLGGDRNFVAEPNAVGCSTGITPASQIDTLTTAWTNDVHGLAGNLLFFDGSVDQVDSGGLQAAFGSGPVDDVVGGRRYYHALSPF
jgi:prepilin-type processing-associated H-X9-DG protein